MQRLLVDKAHAVVNVVRQKKRFPSRRVLAQNDNGTAGSERNVFRSPDFVGDAAEKLQHPHHQAQPGSDDSLIAPCRACKRPQKDAGQCDGDERHRKGDVKTPTP